MKTIILTTLMAATSITAMAQNTFPVSFKRDNGNCGSPGELRLNYAPFCPSTIPYIDSVYTNGSKCAVSFGTPDAAKCNNNNRYISYCVTSGNMPPANVWTIFFRNPNGSTYNSTVTSSTNGTLPVICSSFDAIASGSSIACKWATEQEFNNNYFEVERSFDGTSFTSIALVFSYEQNSNVRRQYSFSDKSAAIQHKEVVWYRIRQVDLDGNSSYSKVISLRLRSSNIPELQALPNPFRSQLEIYVDAPAAGNTEIRLLNTEGRVIITKMAALNKGRNTIRLNDLQGLSHGLYMLQSSVNGQVTGISKLIRH